MTIIHASAFAADEPIELKYDSFKDTNWVLNGEATQLNGGPNDGSIQLTTSQPYVSGSTFYKNPLQLESNQSFSAYFTMKITNAGNGGADGIVFVLAQKTNVVGKDGGGIGYLDLTNSIGVEFDSWLNPSAFGDPDGNHIAVDVNGDLNKPLVVTSAGALEKQGIVLDDGKTKHVWIEYNGDTKKMEVRISTTAVRPVEANVKASNLNLATMFPTGPVYLGFTSATGGAYANHYISKLYFDHTFRPAGIDLTKTYIQNHKPEIAPKSYTIDEDAGPVVDVLKGTDVDGNTLTYKILEQPAHGKLEPNEVTGAFSYAPDKNYSGADSFQVVANDGIVYSLPATYTIKINPVNDAPEGQPLTLLSELGVPVNAMIQATDVENDELQYLLQSFPQKGSIAVDSKTGSLRYVPNAGSTGSDLFTVVVNDGKETSKPIEIKVFITALPQAQNQQSTIDQGKTLEGQLTGTTTRENASVLKYVLTKAPLNGTVELFENGFYKYVPNPGFIGTDRFEFAVDDGKKLSNPAVVEIQINPVLIKPIPVKIAHTLYLYGYPDKTFKPERALTRGELAAAVVRISGVKAPITSKALVFTDMKNNNWLVGYADIAVRTNFLSAVSKGKFGPDQKVSRNDVRFILSKLIAKFLVTSANVQSAKREVSWLGEPDTQIKTTVTRRELALLMNRLFGRGPLQEYSGQTWKDMNPQSVNFTDIMEATVNHQATKDQGKETYLAN